MLTLNDSNVSGNSAIGEFSNGGGIHATFGDISLTNSTVSGNSSYRGGGGISAGNGGGISLTRSTVSGQQQRCR